ncbi:MAG: rhomboid family intramembrane serine protease [Actinomycetota bacterium]|nr:rhomboid family intramembrane serine protease [Actinomycetota bacterium]
MVSLIPISDANPTRRFPAVTIGLIVANVLAFLREPDFGGGTIDASRYFFSNAPIPCQLQATCPAGVRIPTEDGFAAILIPDRGLGSFLISIIVSTFLHAGFLHIAGNMLFLWVFGNNVEDFLGPVKYLLFYLVGGIAASFAHIVVNLEDIIPSVGASGAVAAVMGAYIVLFPHARVRVLVPIFIFFMTQMSAWAVLGLWFVYQFIIGAQAATEATSVAWMAHVGGFVFGVAAIYLLGGRPHRPAPLWRPGWGN